MTIDYFRIIPQVMLEGNHKGDVLRVGLGEILIDLGLDIGEQVTVDNFLSTVAESAREDCQTSVIRPSMDEDSMPG